MFVFPKEISPYCNFRNRPLFRVQGLETMPAGSSQLNFVHSGEAGRGNVSRGTVLRPGDWIGSGTFRNSLFLEPWAQMSSLRDLHLVIDFVGALRIRITRVTRGQPAELLHEVNLQSATRKQHAVSLGSPGDFPEGTRLFWHVESPSVGAQLFDISYCAGVAPRQDCSLVILMRTFGRTADVKALLRRFVDAGQDDPFYANMLNHMHFMVLDTTAGSESAYNDAWLGELNVDVLFGPNLGGGGNAGHLIKLFNDASDASDCAPTEVLILDDDLSMSMETLARYFMFVAYRAQECLTSLPILMKSRPTVVWEDGGFWGRLNFNEASDFSRKRNLFPTLLKHGTVLDQFEKIDAFSPLNTCEYATFIFFGLSTKSLRKLGYPVAFFLRGDDVEMSLRAQDAGMTMITNPNLAAWHEPAHSYGQEYMAILHGIIINFSYGEHDASFYTRFFEERMHEHASIDDAVGLQLYRDILLELLDPTSDVLTPQFQRHYLSKLKALGATRMTRLPDADREVLEQRARESKTLLLPFVYPGYQAQLRKFRNVVLINHPLRSYREVPPMALVDKLTLMQEYGQLMMRLDAEFSTVCKHWKERLKTSAGEPFWTGIRDTYAAQTRVLAAHQRASQPDGAPGPSAGAVVSNGAQDHASQTSLAKKLRVAAQAAVLVSTDPSDEAANMAVLDTDGEPLTLPPDFDAEFYLVMNPDVVESGMTARTHFLQFGRLEGRVYRA
jgi:GT2 family glycosyltransferase